MLRRIARAARYAAWNRSQTDITQFCIKQYNKVQARLAELEPAIAPLFVPLAESASAEIAHIAARELVAYFEGETHTSRRRHHRRGCHGVRVVVG